MPVRVSASPTAQALPAEVAATAASEPPAGSAGPGTCLQAVPSQCPISGTAPVEVSVSPTAQALPEEVAATPYRTEPVPAGTGLGTCLQAVPSQCSITGR